MKIRLSLLFILTCLGLPLAATTVWFSAAPSSADNNTSYYVEATAGAGHWSEPADLWLYKNSSYVNGASGDGWFSAGTNQSDGGPQTVEYYAEVWDYYYYESASAWHWVSINAPANQAPVGVCDYAHSNVPQGGNLHSSGWAVDNEMGAPVYRVDILVDGNDVGDATLGGYRPDVADAYSRSDYTYSGWSFDWGTSGLSLGSHSLELRAWDNQGAYTNFGYRTFNVTAATPSIELVSPSAQTIGLGQALTITSHATDPNGDITTHNLDIQRPDATWNWQGGFANGEPYMGGPVGSAADSTRSASFTFNIVGTWYVRSWVNDAASNSAHSATVAITVVDNTAPSVPVIISPATSITSTSFTLSWNASTDNVGVTGYEVYKNNVYYGTTSGTSLSITGLSAGNTYAMKVRARDAAGNWSALSSPLNVLTGYTVAAPTTISDGSVGSSFITFSWSGASASGGIKNYKVFRNGTYIGTTANSYYTDWTAAAGTSYSYTVKTVDNSDNESAASSPYNKSTLSATFVVFTPLAN